MKRNYFKTVQKSEDTIFQNSIDNLVWWANKNGYEVTFSRNITPFTNIDNKIIAINKSLTLENQLYVFLHELGHIKLANQEGYEQKFSHGYPIFDGDRKKIRRKNTDMHTVHIIHEEYAAWEEGLKIAKDFNIKIDQYKWDKYRCKNIISYIR